MANKVVAVPGIGNVSFPDGMSDGDINSAIEQQLGANKPPDYSSMRPQDIAQQAMQQSGVKKFVSSPATPPNVNMQEQAPTRLGAYGNAVAQNNQNMNKVDSAIGQDVGGLVKGIGNTALQTLTAPSPEQGLGQALLGPIIQSAQDKSQSKAETLGVIGGVNSPAIKQAAQQGDYPSLVGHSIVPILTAALGGRLLKEGAPSLSDMGLPTRAHAGELFSQVEKSAGDIPINTTAPAEVAARAQELASAGGRMPKVIKDFVKRINDPDQPPLTYGEARDFYSNASRLSVKEIGKLNPPMQRQVGQFTSALNDSITGAADEAGKKAEYLDAMGEYAAASRWRNRGLLLSNVAKQTVPYMATAYAAKKIVDGR